MQMNKDSNTERMITLRPYAIEAGDEGWLRHWNQRKDIQEISDDSSLTHTHLNEEILQGNTLLMIELDAEVIGCVSMMFDSNRYSITLGIIIGEPEHRKLGIGTIALCKALEKIHKLESVKMVHAYVYHDNFPAIKLFEKHHFKMAGQVLFKKKSTFHYTLKIP